MLVPYLRSLLSTPLAFMTYFQGELHLRGRFIPGGVPSWVRWDSLDESHCQQGGEVVWLIFLCIWRKVMWDFENFLPCDKGELSVHSYGWALHIVRGCILGWFSLSGSGLLHALSPAVSSLCLFLEESVFAFAWLCWALPLSWGSSFVWSAALSSYPCLRGPIFGFALCLTQMTFFLLLLGFWSFGWTFLFSLSSSVILSCFLSCLVLFLLCFRVSTVGCR